MVGVFEESSVFKHCENLIVPNFDTNVRNICARGVFFLQTNVDFLTSLFWHQGQI